MRSTMPTPHELRRRRASRAKNSRGPPTARRSISIIASTGPLPSAHRRGAGRSGRGLRANPHRISHDLQFGTLDAQPRADRVARSAPTPSEIALATNTSYGINLAAFSLPLKAGDVVLSPDLRVSGERLSVDAARRTARRRVSRDSQCDEGVLDPATARARARGRSRSRRRRVVGAVRDRRARRSRGARRALSRARRVLRRRRHSGAWPAHARSRARRTSTSWPAARRSGCSRRGVRGSSMCAASSSSSSSRTT